MWDCHKLNLNSAATARIGGHWLNNIVLAHPWLINCRDQGQKLNKYGSVESCRDFVRSDPILKSSWWSPLPLRLSHFCWVWRIVVIVVSVYCALEGPRHIWSAGETRTSTNRSFCTTNRLYQYYRYIIIRGGAGLARRLLPQHNSEKSDICLAMFPHGWNCLPAIRVRRPWQLSHCDIVPCPMSTFMATGNMSDFCNYVFIVPLCNMWH